MLKKYFIASSISLLTNCSGPSSDEALLAKLNQAIAPVRTMRTGYKVITLDSLTAFAWDSVYFFHGEEGADFISAFIGIPWNGPNVPNLHSRLLFVHQGKVVRYVDCNEEKANEELPQYPPLPIYLYICPEAGNRGRALARTAARFAVLRTCETGNVLYPLIPMACLSLPAYAEMATQGCNASPPTRHSEVGE